MVDKIKRGIKKYKNKFLVIFILWIILSIVFVAPLGIAIKEAGRNGAFNFETFVKTIGETIVNPLSALGSSLTSTYISSFWSVWWKYTLI